MIVSAITADRTFTFTLGVLAGILFAGILDCVQTVITMRHLERVTKADKERAE